MQTETRTETQETSPMHVTAIAGGKVHSGRSHARGIALECSGRTVRGLLGTTAPLTCKGCIAKAGA